MTRDDDTLTRHGNREFLYLRTELTNEANATEVAEEMVQVLSSSVKVNNKASARLADLKPYIGIAVYPRDGETAAELVGRADEARHRAKLAGKGHSYAR